jgi:hypothetical protein
VQRQRTRGWTAPLDEHGQRPIYVGRGSRWGNPFAVGALYVSRTAFHDAPVLAKPHQQPGIREHAAWDGWPAWTETVGIVRDRAHAVELFRAHVTYFDDTWDREEIRRELGGRDLMCWCPLPEPGEPDWCHGAVLLRLANPVEVAA